MWTLLAPCRVFLWTVVSRFIFIFRYSIIYSSILPPDISSMLTYCAVLPYIVHLALSLSVDLSNSSLREVPNNISVNVKVLLLHKNNIQRLEDDSLSNYSVLVSVDLNHNEIEFVSENAFRYTPNVKILRLKHNKLDTFPNLMLLPKLKWAPLNDNRIQLFPEKHISASFNLKKLAVAKNHLINLPNLSHLTSMDQLSVYENNLTTIPDCYDLPLTGLYMAFNPWVCDITLCWIRMWPFKKPALDLEVYSGGVAKCAAPASLAGIALMDAHPVDMECYEGKCEWIPWEQGSWDQHGAHLGPTGPRWAPCWPHVGPMNFAFWVYNVWGDSPTSFTSDAAISENRWRITSQMTIKPLFVTTCMSLYSSHALFGLE